MSKKVSLPWWWLNVEIMTLILTLGGLLIMYLGVTLLARQQSLAAQLWVPLVATSAPKFEFNWQVLSASQLRQRMVNHFAKKVQGQDNQAIKFTQTDKRLDLFLRITASQIHSLHTLPVTPGWTLAHVKASLPALILGSKDAHYIVMHLSWKLGDIDIKIKNKEISIHSQEFAWLMTKAFYKSEKKAFDEDGSPIVSAYIDSNATQKAVQINLYNTPKFRYLGYLNNVSRQAIGVWLGIDNSIFSGTSTAPKPNKTMVFLQLGQDYMGWQLILANTHNAVLKKGVHSQWLPLCEAHTCTFATPYIARGDNE